MIAHFVLIFGLVILSSIETAPVPGGKTVHTTHTTHHTSKKSSGGKGGTHVHHTSTKSGSGGKGGITVHHFSTGGGDINVDDVTKAIQSGDIHGVAKSLNMNVDDLNKALSGDTSQIASILHVNASDLTKALSGDVSGLAAILHINVDVLNKAISSGDLSGLASSLNINVTDLTGALNGDLGCIASILGINIGDLTSIVGALPDVNGVVGGLTGALPGAVGGLTGALPDVTGALGGLTGGLTGALPGGNVNIAGGLPPGIDLGALGGLGIKINGDSIYIPDIPGIDRNVPGIVNHNHHMKLSDPAFHGVENDRCREGLIDGVALGLRDGLDDITDGLMDVITGITGDGTVLGPIGNAVQATGLGAQALLLNFFDGTFSVISDAACGLGDMADTFASALDTGNILEGIGEGGKEFIFGMGSMLNDAGSHFIGGIDSAVEHVGNWVDDPFTGH